jgi:hypothetical protein
MWTLQCVIRDSILCKIKIILADLQKIIFSLKLLAMQ